MPIILRSRLARNDLRDIWLYIARDNSTAADRLLDRIDKVVSMLGENPDLGERQDHLKVGLRRFVVLHYLIFYEEIEGGIQIVRILHGARDIDDLF